MRSALLTAGTAAVGTGSRWLRPVLGRLGLTRLAGRLLRSICTSQTAVYQVGAHRMHLYTFDIGGISQVNTRTFWAEWSGPAMVFQRLLRDGMVVVDAGAHVGFYTLLASTAVGSSGVVYAFEPDPQNVRLLRRNVELNACRNVVPEAKALSNCSGRAALMLGPTSVDHSLYGVRSRRDQVLVEMVSLDDFFRDKPRRLDVLRMNIEGGELAVIDGMDGLLAANPSMRIFTEFNPSSIRAGGTTPERFLGALTERGFRMWRVGERPPGALDPVSNGQPVALNKYGTAYLLLTRDADAIPA